MECLRNNFNTGIVLGGRYQTISPLNHGSFGMVFLAKDLKTGKTVAVKCLTKRAAANEAGFDLAIDDKSEELVLHRRLGHHPNIVNLVDSFETDAHVYLVLEFCEQGDLYEAIRMGHGPLETEHVRRFMLELVDAVAYMHSKGVYHRDIKPENIFLAQSGSMKLGDFGLATTEHWTYETAVGSDRYMSPEQYDSDGAGYSPAQADIWAIGICLLNILFARNPFNTPSEDDKFFLDFSRDKQSLFDVFPSMSQDTYEIIVECMNLDPNKRSLVGARRALTRAVSFTTSDETLDDFCSADAVVVASTNREPLRTPSIQSPHFDSGGPFPWAQALNASTLSAIPDEENWSEDLFSNSVTTADWMSADAQTPSMSSVLDLNFASSMQSLNIGQLRIPTKAATKVSPMAGSLPISMAKPRLQSAMSMVFGRKDTVSKSWSDMWDEDVEEEENARQLHALKEMNSRTWSHESNTAFVDKDSDDTPRAGLSPATKSATMSTEQDIPSIDSTLTAKDIDEDLGADGFFFQEALPGNEPLQRAARYSPPPKRSNVDKWAALGERRRAYTGSASTKTAGVTIKTGRQMGTGMTSSGSTGNGYGVSGFFDMAPNNTSYSFFNFTKTPSNHNNTYHKWNHTNNIGKERVKECSRSKGRDRDWNWNFDWRKEKRHAFGDDIQWVGGWQETHS